MSESGAEAPGGEPEGRVAEGRVAEGQAGLTVEVLAEQTHEQAVASASQAILRHPELRRFFPAGDLWLMGFDVVDKDSVEGSTGGRFTTTVHDTVTGRTARVHGRLDDSSALRIDPVAHQWPPGEDEHAWAAGEVAADGELGELLRPDGSYTYRPLPPMANVEHADGSVERVVAVGIRTGGAEPAHRIVGVRISDGELLRQLPGIQAPADEELGPPPGSGCPAAAAAGAGQARVRVSRGDEVLWDLVVVRPRSSSGTAGSGVELREVDFKGQRVLGRAHLPIVTLRYGGAGDDGPTFRLWQHEESCFAAEGTDPVLGFRLCASPPRTMVDSGADDGDFRGVALWLDGEELVVVSQLQAGWCRHLSEWRLHADGTVRPRFACACVANPWGRRNPVHHAYWRLDFDVLGADSNVVQEYNDPPVLGTGNWHTARYEVSRRREAATQRFWRVRNTRASQGYSVMPGPGDDGPGDDGPDDYGAGDDGADDYGAGDVWILRHHGDEVDDGQGFTTTPSLSRAGLDRFVSGEVVERHDVVVWYAAHVGSGTAAAASGRRVGPDLVPYQWKEPPGAQAPFVALQPPGEGQR